MSALRIDVLPYDPSWPLQFERERARLGEALGAEALAIEHFGSTAVPGLAAKPILDILIARRPHVSFERWAERLRPLGLLRARVDSTGAGEEQWFFRDDPRARHVHSYPVGSPALRRHLAFRDALRADPMLRDAYARLKLELAEREWGARQEYVDAKSEFVRRVEREALRA